MTLFWRPAHPCPRHRPDPGHHSDDDDQDSETTPIYRCRVLYLGSHETKDETKNGTKDNSTIPEIQEPLAKLYPKTGLRGISSVKEMDSWLSIWSNGLLLEHADEKRAKFTRFFPVEYFQYFAAVKNVGTLDNGGKKRGGKSKASTKNDKGPTFVSLDSPLVHQVDPNPEHPPIFACVLRLDTNPREFDCHAFICKRDDDAHALVDCCVGVYTDWTTAKEMDIDLENRPSTNGGSNSRRNQRSVTPLESIERGAGKNGNSLEDMIAEADSEGEDLPDGPMTSTPRERVERRGAEFSDDDDLYDEGVENHRFWGQGQNGRTGTGTDTLKSDRPPHLMRPPLPPPPFQPPHFGPPNPAEFVGGEKDAKKKKKHKKKSKKELKKEAMDSQKQQEPFLIRPASMMNLGSPHTMSLPRGQILTLDRRPKSVLNGPIYQSRGEMFSSCPELIPHFPHPHMRHNGFPSFPPQMPMHPRHMPMPMQPLYGTLPYPRHPPPRFNMRAAHPHPHPPPLPELVKESKSKSKSKAKSKKNQEKQKDENMDPVPVLPPPPGPPGFHPRPHPQERQSMPILPPGFYTPQHRQQQQQNPGSSKMMIPEMKQNLMRREESNGEGHQGQGHGQGSTSHYATIERSFHYTSRPSRMVNGESATLPSKKSRASSQPVLPQIPPPATQGMKKELEIIQMVSDLSLDLSDDDTEMKEVPNRKRK